MNHTETTNNNPNRNQAMTRSGAGHSPSPGMFVPKSSARATAEVIRRPSVSYWQDAWMRIRKNRLAMLSAAYIAVLTVAVIVGPWLIEYTHDEQENWNQNLSPSLGQPAIVVDAAQLQYEPVTVAAPAAWSTTADPAVTGEFSVEPPAAPSSVEVMNEPLTTGIAIKWSPVSGADGYRIYRSIREDTDGVPMPEPEAGTLSMLDQGELLAGQTYIYAVFAYNAFGDSTEAARIRVTPRLALTLEDAQKFKSDAVVGTEVLTHPHYLGTDHLGRDLLARLFIGGRVSLFIGFFAPLIFIFVGVLYGCISGYVGGIVDDLMMRFADMVSTVPDLLALIILQVFLGSGLSTLVIALVMVSWARSARQIRGEVLRLRESEFVYAAKILGTSTRKIIVRHLLPNTTGTILVLFTLAIPQAIFTEAFLSYVGLGIKPPLASWGMVVNEGAKNFATYPHQVLVPALVISLTMLAFNKLGDGLRDALDPRLRGAE
jgi:oligopeptide transport system permease protein